MHPALTAAGHDGAQQGAGLFIKPSTQQEIDFYQWINSHQSPLAEFLPRFMGTLVEKTPQAAAPEARQPYLVLEDLCEGFAKPAIMDVKLGKQLWDSFTPPDKRQRLQNVANTTTSGTLGFRIAGLSVINPGGERQAFGKQFGREATIDSVDRHLAAFWPALHNEYVLDGCLAGIIARLNELYDVLAGQPLEFHSASVLLLYEGDLAALQETTDRLMNDADPHASHHPTPDHDSPSESEPEVEPKILDVRLIDFAHTTKADKPDADTLGGLKNLIAELQKIHHSHTQLS